MLYQYKNDDGKVFNLAPHNNFTIESENIFTTIVGQNGTGKSRLLEFIVQESLTYNKFTYPLKNSVLKSYSFSNIIALSISPFDRFPATQSMKDYNHNYSYLGLEDLFPKDLSKEYFSKIIKSLISYLYQNKKSLRILDILNYLGYKGFIEFEFKLDREWKYLIKEFTKVNEDNIDIRIELFKAILQNAPHKKKKLYSKLYDSDGKAYDIQYIKYSIQIIEKMKFLGINDIPSFIVNENRLQTGKKSAISIFDINFLLLIDMLKLIKVSFQKIAEDKPFIINEASSGEQSVIMSMLGIASKIENGSLICIDEPEVCLHPAWQEKYIKFLMNTFKDYKGCHFLIATHSPQITSKLEDENCYVMSMDDGKLLSASTLNKKSIDFQLAHVFKSPGFKNEYLTRELISLITLISEGKGQEELHSTKIEEILALKDVIDDDDPVKELIKMVESVKKELS